MTLKDNSEYLEAKSLFANKKFKLALECFKSVKEHWQNESEIDFYMGKCCFYLGRYPSVTKHMLQVIKNYNKESESSGDKDMFFKANYYKGFALFSLHKYSAAIKNFSTIDEKHDLYGKSLMYTTLSLEKLSAKGQILDINNVFEKLVDLFQRSESYKDQMDTEIVHKFTMTRLIQEKKYDLLIDFCKDNQHETNQLLMHATILEEKGLIEKLLELKADPFLINKDFKSAFTVAISDERNQAKLDIAKMFLQKSLPQEDQKSLDYYLNAFSSSVSSSTDMQTIVSTIDDYYDRTVLNHQIDESCVMGSNNTEDL